VNIPGFALQSRYLKDMPSLAKEEMAVHYYALMEKVPVKVISDPKKVPTDWIPVGTVQYCEKILGTHILPDYYPGFLSGHLYRKVWKTNEWPLGKKIFIKPADRYKRFTGFVTNGGYKGKKRSPYWCSDPVTFTNEWRYYVANGKILTGEWYQGDEENTPDAPGLEIDMPKDYCGAIDFGTLDTGELALVEAHHPFACGWYGKDHQKYVKFLYWGWQYTKKIVEKTP
jgi:hypothetical protein